MFTFFMFLMRVSMRELGRMQGHDNKATAASVPIP